VAPLPAPSRAKAHHQLRARLVLALWALSWRAAAGGDALGATPTQGPHNNAWAWGQRVGRVPPRGRRPGALLCRPCRLRSAGLPRRCGAMGPGNMVCLGGWRRPVVRPLVARTKSQGHHTLRSSARVPGISCHGNPTTHGVARRDATRPGGAPGSPPGVNEIRHRRLPCFRLIITCCARGFLVQSAPLHLSHAAAPVLMPESMLPLRSSVCYNRFMPML
jgi:hypothetical protein